VPRKLLKIGKSKNKRGSNLFSSPVQKSTAMTGL